MSSEALITLIIGVAGVWIQVIILAFFLGRHTERLGDHAEMLEDHEKRLRVNEGKLTAVMGYKGLEG